MHYLRIQFAVLISAVLTAVSSQFQAIQAQTVPVTPPPQPGLNDFGANAGGYAPNFVVVCPISHRGPVDPIGFPGRVPSPHIHEFFGNRSTNANSTPASLLANPATTCHRSVDHSGYWVPTLYQNGAIVTPTRLDVYYQASRNAPVKALPAGLKMVAGMSSAMTPQSPLVAGWSCGPQGVRTADVPSGCFTGQNANKPKVSMYQIFFPNCWDGKNLDSPDHMSHMAYGTDITCPASHPVLVPTVRFVLIYPYLGEGGPGVAFSSGGSYSAHADFMNGWEQPQLQSLIKQCLVAGKRCGVN